jgi:hypothetical protein
VSNKGHDAYGKSVVRAAAAQLGVSFQEYGTGHPITPRMNCSIDAVVAGKIAVEIESRTPKQVRGAVLDVFWHPAPLKLIVLLPAYIGNPANTVEMCECLANTLYPGIPFRCIALTGKGDNPQPETDVALLAQVMKEMLA